MFSAALPASPAGQPGRLLATAAPTYSTRRAQAPLNGEGCRQEAARALSNLSCNNDAGQGSQMVDCGAVPLLADMMRVRGGGWVRVQVGGCGWVGADGWHPG